jgi:hypothetical protein
MVVWAAQQAAAPLPAGVLWRGGLVKGAMFVAAVQVSCLSIFLAREMAVGLIAQN